MDFTHHWDSPLGGITLASDGEALTGLWFDGQRYYAAGLDVQHLERRLSVFDRAEAWLRTYFSGQVPDFTPPIHVRATPFRRAVWEILLTIPYGQTTTYGEIASQLAAHPGFERASARAVGGAVGHNPIALIIPCHRVVGANGSLTGYAGGLERKTWLLALEGSRDKEEET